MARIGTLLAGEKFRTLLTGRSGRILPVILSDTYEEVIMGIPVRFNDGEMKTLHPEVRVEVVYVTH